MSNRTGLTHTEAAQRLKQFGPNEIRERGGRTAAGILIDQFTNVLVWLLLGAAAVSYLIGDVVDTVLVLAIVVLNSVLGWIQEYKAETAVKQLKKMGAGRVRVLRSEREMEIDARGVVPGDLVHLEEGTRIAADGIVLEAVELEINEAALTGESLPVSKADAEKDKKSALVFQGTVVSRGRGWMEVKTTGDETRFGQLAGKLQTIETESTPLQRKLTKVARYMVAFGGGMCILVAGLIWLRERETVVAALTGVSLAVAVIPEGLPTVIAVTLALGVQRMARQKAVVRRMAAVEALGATTVIATDKTGTITKNEMEVREVEVDGQVVEVGEVPSLAHNEYARMLVAGVVCSSAVLVHKITGGYEVLGDQTEGALLKLAQDGGLVPDMVRERVKMLFEFPFDSSLRRMTVVVRENDGDEWIYTKGSVEKVLEKCQKTAQQSREVRLPAAGREEIRRRHDEMARKGLRVIALAYKKRRREKSREEAERNLVWLGMVGIADPLRPDARDVLVAARRDGIGVVMITGDNPLTAAEIARQAGMVDGGEEIMTGDQLDEAGDENLEKIVGRVRVFARVRPEHKLKIVEALQASGEHVVVTGDGVNDALALKKANVGVAMGVTGTDVARETADVVLLDDQLRTLLTAIENGRVIVANMTRTVRYLLSCNLGEMLTIVMAVAAGWETPLLPVQILWVNLVTDGLPALALAMDPRPADEQARARQSRSDLLTRNDFGWLMGVGTAIAVLSLAAFGIWGRAGAFTALVAGQLAVALSLGGRKQGNMFLLAAVLLALGLQLAIISIPVLRLLFEI